MEQTIHSPHSRIEMLGGLRIRQGERLITRFPTYKTGALLAYLAYFPQRDASREMLIEMLWPDYSNERARNNLSHALSVLRVALEPVGATGAVLIADRHNIRIEPDHVTTDVSEFLTALRRGAETNDETEQAEWLAAAVTLYKGELLPGYYEEWIPAERERLAESHLQALRRLVRNSVNRKDPQTAIEYAQRAVSADIVREETHRVLIRLFMETGQLSAARQQYREMESALLKTLGETPSAASRKLLQEIETRRQAEPATAPQPAISALRRPVPATIEATTALPTGIVTLLLTEITGEAASEQTGAETLQSAATPVLRNLLETHCTSFGGRPVREITGGCLIAFTFASKALEFAFTCLRALGAPDKPTPLGPGSVRMALDTGEFVEQEPASRERALQRLNRLIEHALAGQILCSETTAILLQSDLPDGLALRDLGIFPSTSAARSERLFLIESSDLRQSETRASHPNATAGGALPVSLTRFFGRQTEVTTLRERLQQPQIRLVTLSGLGGTGKTRLAQEVASSLKAEFDGAVWFVPLVDITDAARLPRVIADALRLPASQGEETLDQIVTALAAQPSLIVLDNFEQLVETGAAVITTLLSRAPQLTLLITSRHVLRLTSEHEFSLSPMNVPGHETVADHLAQNESVQLFLDRAQMVRSDLCLSESNAADIAALCNRLEGLPLAIELAAGRAAILAPAQMLHQLDDRFKLLVTRNQDVPERHHTLLATLEWSFALLDPALRAFFARLSVFRGGWTIAAAEEICEEPLALDLLAQLRECSLLQTVESDAQIRFRMLETVREFAAQHLSAEEQSRYIRLHLDYFLKFAGEIAGREMQPQRAHPKAKSGVALLAEEQENLRAALAQAVPAQAEQRMRLANALLPFWQLRGLYREGRRWLEPAADNSLPLTPRTRAVALHGAGTLALLQGEYADAARLLEQCLPMRCELGDKEGEAATRLNLGILAYYRDDLEQAEACFRMVVSLQTECQNRAGAADAQVWLGNLAHRRGDLPEAQRLFGESLVHYQNQGATARSAYVLNNLANLAHEQAQGEAALALFQQCLDFYRQEGVRAEIARTLNNQGNVLRELGRIEEANIALQESLALSRELENGPATALTLNTLGVLHCARGDYAAARNCFLESWLFYRQRNDREGLAYTLTGLAEVALGEGQADRAVRLLAQAHGERSTLNLVLPRNDQRDWDRVLNRAQTALSPGEFDAAWRIGRTMPLALDP